MFLERLKTERIIYMLEHLKLIVNQLLTDDLKFCLFWASIYEPNTSSAAKAWAKRLCIFGKTANQTPSQDGRDIPIEVVGNQFACCIS